MILLKIINNLNKFKIYTGNTRSRCDNSTDVWHSSGAGTNKSAYTALHKF